jgi:Bax protein
MNSRLLALLFWLLFLLVASVPFWYSTQEVQIEEPQQVSPTPAPIEVNDIPDFAAIFDVKEKKQAFINYLQPVFEQQNKQILQTREALLQLQSRLMQSESLTEREAQWLASTAKEYKEELDTGDYPGLISALLTKADVIPLELALMQAANESGWGTSRFAQEGYNFFGLWCYRKGCGFVPAKRDSEARHEVAKFTSITHATERYMLNLNAHYAYDYMREIRASLRAEQQPLDPELIATGLVRYSQRGVDYVEELINMMRVNRKYISSNNS